MPEDTGAAGGPIGGDKSKRAAALAAVQARLDDVVKGRNYASAAATGALGELDATKQAGGKPSKEENAQLDECVVMFACDESREAAAANKVPPEALKSNVAMLRYLYKACE